MKRAVGSDRMVEVFHEGVAKNLSEAKLNMLKPRLDQLDRSYATHLAPVIGPDGLGWCREQSW
jgi:hypothetical protein